MTDTAFNRETSGEDRDGRWHGPRGVPGPLSLRSQSGEFGSPAAPKDERPPVGEGAAPREGVGAP